MREREGEGEGDFDGGSEDDAARADTDRTGVGRWVGGRVTVGDGLRAACVGAECAGAAVVATAAPGLREPVPAPVRAACASAVREPAKVSRPTLTAATIHIATAAAAIAAPGLARMLPQLARLIARENRANHIDSACRATRRR